MDHLTIIKVGGKVLEDPSSFEHFLGEFERIKGLKVLVHGGGSTASALQRQLGQEPVMVNGRRVTDEDALKAVTMVYAGLINKRVVARLNAGGIVKAVGLSGADGALITTTKRPVTDIDYGFVGDIADVDLGVLHILLQHAFVPIIAPITASVSGQLLNTNADTMAQALATATAKKYEVVLMFAFDRPGVLLDPHDDTSVIPFMNTEAYKEMKANGVFTDGMIPKLENAFAALEAGVAAVRLCAVADMFTGGGTTLTL